MESVICLLNYGYKALINLNRGANCISLRNDKYDAIILREPDYDKGIDNPYSYGMPILYPVNRISGGKFIFEDREYIFPINEPLTNCHLHGAIHNAPFKIIKQSEDFIKCEYKTEATNGFPHSFKIEITYYLDNDGLTQKTEIFNLSDINMPSFLGFHTTFNIPFIQNSVPDSITVKADLDIEIERDTETYLPTGNILREDDVTQKIKSGKFMPLSKKISRHYRACGDGKIEIFDNKNKLKIIYANDTKLGWRLFYNGNADEFICLEAMTCMVNCQNAPYDRLFSGFDYIEPHSSKKYTSKIGLEEFSL